MLSSIWHGFEIAMMAFHGFIWGRFVIRRIWARITISNTIHYKQDTHSELKNEIGVIEYKGPPPTQGLPGQVLTSDGTGHISWSNNVASIFKEAYGDKIVDLIPMENRDAYRIVNTDDEISSIDIHNILHQNLSITNPKAHSIIKKLGV